MYKETFLKLEELKPMHCAKELLQRLKDLRQLIQVTQKKVQTAPQGHLKVCRRAEYTELYFINEEGQSKGEYIPNKQRDFAAQLAQKDYDAKLIKVVEKEICALENYLKKTDSFTSIEKLYEKLSPGRQSLITPVTLPDKQYAEKWMKSKEKQQTFLETFQKYTTAQGEMVRSKSEVIIADTLFRYGIPYCYEVPLKIKTRPNEKITVHPDFLCLNVRTREDFYWEHFGLMDNPEYLSNAISKIRNYSNNGIFPGRKLIFTMETSESPLSISEIEENIKEFLL